MKTTRNGKRNVALLFTLVFVVAATDALARPHGGYFGRGRGGGFHGGNWSGRGYYSAGFSRGHGFGGGYSYYGFGHSPFRRSHLGYLSSYSPYSYFGRNSWSRPYYGFGGYPYQSYLPGYGYQTYCSPAPVDDSIYYPQMLYVYNTPDYGDDVEGGMKAAAWHYLAEGSTSEASSIFAAMERQMPGKGWPKIGAGLIAGFSGNYNRAQYNFLRGFRFDPDGPGELPEEPGLQEKLTVMVEYYRDIVSRTKKNQEAEFMLAASAYLAGDYPTARMAIDRAIAYGDDSRSSRNLKTLVEQAGTRLAQADQ